MQFTTSEVRAEESEVYGMSVNQALTPPRDGWRPG